MIALANAKGDFTAEHADTKTEGESEGGPAVTQGSGSVDQDSTSVEHCSANGDSRPGYHGDAGRPEVGFGAGSWDLVVLHIS
jgi:hypothetical protein